MVKACTKLLVEQWGRQCHGDVVEALVHLVDTVSNPTAAEELAKAWFQARTVAPDRWTSKRYHHQRWRRSHSC